MPGQQSNDAGQLFYSWNIGPVHVVSYNTEVFFFPDIYSHHDMQGQYAWLEQVRSCHGQAASASQ